MASSGYSDLYDIHIFYYLFLSLLFIFVGQWIVENCVDASPSESYYLWQPSYEIKIEDTVEFPNAMEFSPDGIRIAFFANNLVIFNSTSKVRDIQWTPPSARNPFIIRWSPDGSMVAWRYLDHVEVLDLLSLKLVADIVCDEYVSTLEFNKDGSLMFISTAQYLYIVDTSVWRQIERLAPIDTSLTGIHCFTWNPKEDFLFIFGNTCHKYRYGTWESLGEIEGLEDVQMVAWVNSDVLLFSTQMAVYDYNFTNGSPRLLLNYLDNPIKVYYDRISDSYLIHENGYGPKMYSRRDFLLVQDFDSLFSSPLLCKRLEISPRYDDLAIIRELPHYTYQLLLLRHFKITEPILGPRNTKIAFAMFESYEFSFLLDDVIKPDRLSTIQASFGSQGIVSFDVLSNTAKSVENYIICDGGSLQRLSNGTSLVRFNIWFNWTFPDQDLTNISLSLTMNDSTMLRWTYPGVLTVVTRLSFQGEIDIIRSSSQDHVGSGDWVGSGERLEWILPTVFYKGYPTVMPKREYVQMELMRESIIEWSGGPSDNGTTRIILLTPEIDLGIFNYVLTLGTVNDTGVHDTRSILFRVDGIAPIFVGYMPETDIWQAANDNPIGTWVMDGAGSGVEGQSVELRWRISSISPWSEWNHVQWEHLANGSIFGWSNPLLAEGIENWIQWRCNDHVGNSNETVALRVRVDLHHVVFIDYKPAEWQGSREVNCSVTLSDLGGSGVLGGSVMIRWSTSGLAGYGPWTSLGLSGVRTIWEVTWPLLLEAGEANFIQWRAEDVAGTGLIESAHTQVFIDIVPPTFGQILPVGPQPVRIFMVSVEVKDDGGSGLDRIELRFGIGEINYGWQPVDSFNGAIASANISVFQDGLTRAQFRASDKAGNIKVSDVFEWIIDTIAPVFKEPHPASGSMLIGVERNVSIGIVDNLVGVDPTRIEWSFRMGETIDWSAWKSISDVVVEGAGFRATVNVTLSPSHSNWVRFRAWDFLGNGPGLSEDILLPVDLPPEVIIYSPTTIGEYWADTPIIFDARSSKDPENGKLTFVWVIGNDSAPIKDSRFEKILAEGTYRIILTAIDENGQTNRTEVTITVLPIVIKEPSTLYIGLLLLVILLICTILTIYLWKKRRK